MNRSSFRGFTIVELLIVIVVIAILAAITIVAFNGIQKRAALASVQSDLKNATTQLSITFETTGSYPADTSGLRTSSGVTFQYTASGGSYCISAIHQRVVDAPMYSASDSPNPREGVCDNHVSSQEAAAAIAAGNMALSSSITSSIPITQGSPSFITNGITNLDNQYAGVGGGLQWVRVDLGSPKAVGRIVIWHYYLQPRQYHQPKTEVSADGINWYTVYDGAVSGQYDEVAAGKTMTFAPRKIRYIRDYIAGSTANGSNHWTEIQAFYQ